VFGLQCTWSQIRVFVFQLSVERQTPLEFVVLQQWPHIKHFAHCETGANWIISVGEHDSLRRGINDTIHHLQLTIFIYFIGFWSLIGLFSVNWASKLSFSDSMEASNCDVKLKDSKLIENVHSNPKVVSTCGYVQVLYEKLKKGSCLYYVSIKFAWNLA
jgi:hypothetical protein